MYESNTGTSSNGLGAHFFAGVTNQGTIRRCVIAFDLAGDIPGGSTINNVTLTLNMSKSAHAGTEDMSLHKLLADWGEGGSNAAGEEGSGTSSATGDATWIHTFFDTSSWAAAGGDFESAASVTTNVGSNNSPYQWRSTAQMVADVRDWLDDPSGNFGWLLMGNESTQPTAKRFDSKDNSNANVRPVLEVDFTPPILATSTLDHLVCLIESSQAGTSSAAMGVGKFTINTQANTLNYTISFGGLSSGETAAHIHGFAAPGLPADVLHTLPAGNSKSGVWNYEEGQEQDILAGKTYVNIHSTNYSGGEIRGQLVSMVARLDTSQANDPTNDSPVDAKQNPMNGHWYAAIDESVMWDEARAAAESLVFNGKQGHLATLTSAEENDWVFNNLPNNFSFWLGGIQVPAGAAPNDGWQWITDESWSYTNWSSGEPNDAGAGNEDRLVVFPNTGRWNDANEA